MKLEAIVRVEPHYIRHPEAVEAAVKSASCHIVLNWLRQFPNSTLLLRRPRQVTTNVGEPSYPVHKFQATATVIPAPQFDGERLLGLSEIHTMIDAFYRDHRTLPNTLLLPPNFRIAIPGEYLRIARAELDLNSSNKPLELFGQLKVIENAPRLAVALL